MPDPVLFVFPTQWDAAQLASCRSRWADGYAPVFAEPTDVDCPAELDVLAYVDRAAEAYAGRIGGVTSSSDYPGATVAAALAQRLDLPGPAPAHVLRCSHKYFSRVLQREAAPEAVPPFALVDARDPRAALTDVTFPCFVKPVKGAFSVFTRRIETPDELVAFLSTPAVAEYTEDYLAMFHALVRTYLASEVDGHFFVAEAVLRGRPATVEGYAQGGGVTILGVVDSVVHPGTRSFKRFDYPSALPPGVQARMCDVARRVARRLELDGALFNIEMVWDADADRVGIIEVNPRLCGQFADLYAKVDGTNTYETALALATGRTRPRGRGRGGYAAAASLPLRIFSPARVLRAPDAAALETVRVGFPDALIWNECATGDEFADMAWAEDGESFRYAVINVGGADAAACERLGEAIRTALGFAFAPLAGAAAEERP